MSNGSTTSRHVDLHVALLEEARLRWCLVDCFVSLRLRLKRVFYKTAFSCCKTPYSIRYKLLHRTVTKQSTKHLLILELMCMEQRRKLRRCLDDCFVSSRLRLKRVFTKWGFSCCKTPYSIRYKVLHRTVTNQSTKHLLSHVERKREFGSQRRGSSFLLCGPER